MIDVAPVDTEAFVHLLVVGDKGDDCLKSQKCNPSCFALLV